MKEEYARRVRLRTDAGPYGVGVYADQPVAAGRLVLAFAGEALPGAEIADFSHSLQIGPDLYLGPSGGIDDLVNHSCDPNCGLVERSGRFGLMALRRIDKDTELTFDYSTSMNGEPWGLECACGSSRCRGRIGDFWDLPPGTRRRYLTLGVVPRHVQEARYSAAADLSRTS